MFQFAEKEKNDMKKKDAVPIHYNADKRARPDVSSHALSSRFQIMSEQEDVAETQNKYLKAGENVIQRKIYPEKEKMDNGKLISSVRNRMEYKDKFRKKIVEFYKKIVNSNDLFINEVVLDKIVALDWNKEDNLNVIPELSEECARLMDLRYGGDGAHMVSRHIQISDDALKDRVLVNRINRASRFAKNSKGQLRAMSMMEKLQRILGKRLSIKLINIASTIIDAREGNDLNIELFNRDKDIEDSVKAFLDYMNITYNQWEEEQIGDFGISTNLKIKVKARTINITCDYKVDIWQMFEKDEITSGDSTIRRVSEYAQVFPGRNKPQISIDAKTTIADVQEMIEESGMLERVGTTVY